MGDNYYNALTIQGRRQVLEVGGGGGASVGVSLRGVSLFVSRMLLPSFVFFTPKLWGHKRPQNPLAYALAILYQYKRAYKYGCHAATFTGQ